MRILSALTPLAAAVLVITTHAAPPSETLPQFTDVTTAAGIHFRHTSGAFGKKYLPETLGSGVAVFDADNDGFQDILLVNGQKWPGQPGPPTFPALYHKIGRASCRD